MILYKIHELENSEGSIVSILKGDNDFLYIMDKTDDGKKQIITKTNHFQLSLYLESRVTLKELFLMNQDEYYIIISGEKAEAVFFEITTDKPAHEIEKLQCGSQLYHLIPASMRTLLSKKDVLSLLPIPISTEDADEIYNAVINMDGAGVRFFNSEKSPISIVSIESEQYNPDEHDYFMCTTQYGKEDILVKINPYILFLFLQNRLSVTEVFKCRMHDYYIVHDGGKFTHSKYNPFIKSLLQELDYLNKTYYTLPSTMRIEAPMEKWKHYVDFNTISGKGVLETEFKSSYLINVKFKKI